jgi:hypothetical protein
LDQATGTLLARLDETVTHRRVPTYLVSDNAKTVTTEHVARIAVRHPMVAALPGGLMGTQWTRMSRSPGVQSWATTYVRPSWHSGGNAKAHTG